MKINTTMVKILKFIEQTGSQRREIISEILKVPRTTTQEQLTKLEILGILKKEKKKEKLGPGRARVYWAIKKNISTIISSASETCSYCKGSVVKEEYITLSRNIIIKYCSNCYYCYDYSIIKKEGQP